MERVRLQGVKNIVRFNRGLYALSAVAIFSLILVAAYTGQPVFYLISIAAAGTDARLDRGLLLRLRLFGSVRLPLARSARTERVRSDS